MKPKTCAHCRHDLTGASIYTIQGIDVCADIRSCLARQAEREPLRDEFGVRADFTDTTSAEFTVADNLADALRALDEFDAKHGGRVVSRELVERPVGGWRKVGDEKCGDVYHRYDDDPLVCTLDRGHIGTHCGQGAEWPIEHEFGDRHETGMRSETTVAEAMSDERLAEIRKECGPRSIFVSGVSGDGLCVMTNELLAEVERLRKQLADVTAQRNEWHRQNGLLRGELEQAREEGAARAALGTSPAVWCWNRHPDHPLPCGRFARHEGPHVRGEHRWEDTAPQQPETRCQALSNTRLNLQCSRPEGHDAAHVAELDGMGRFSWHGDVPQQSEDGDRG